MGIEDFRRVAPDEGGIDTVAAGRIRLNTKYSVSQVVVRKVDGSQFMCDDMHQFSGSPHGPMLYGEDGSVGLYVTDFRRNPDDEWIETDPKEKDWGDFFTIIPASQISDVKLRLK